MSALHRLLGGDLMFSAGVLYLHFEKSLLSFPPGKRNTDQPSPPTPSSNSLSQSIFGVQIGLILLAMIVTRSSIASLQAKRGLPLGNQGVGWLVLSTTNLFTFTNLSRFFYKKKLNELISPPLQSHHSPFPSSTAYSQIIIISAASS